MLALVCTEREELPAQVGARHNARKPVPHRDTLNPLPPPRNPLQMLGPDLRVYPGRKTIALCYLNCITLEVQGPAFGWGKNGSVGAGMGTPLEQALVLG